MTPHAFLAPHRSALVLAATGAMNDTVQKDIKPKLEKAQLSHLVGVCNAATCAEEIELYLQYQASRDRPSWPRRAADDVIRRLTTIIPASTEQPLRVAAWRLYAVYLARAFTYARAVANADAPLGGPDRSPAHGPKPDRSARHSGNAHGGRR